MSYPGTNVLKGLALEVRPGDVYGLVGRNAAGKTTLLKTLMRCIEPLRGSILYWGREIHQLAPDAWRRISYLGEMAGVLPTWTVRRMLAFQEQSCGSFRRDRAERLLAGY